MPRPTLSVLDQSPVRAGGTFADALAESVELARAAERLGFQRYWVAEHHGTEGFAGSAPEILVAHIASATRRIRVGSGGVMLSHYSPFKVAETFRLLEVMFPGRIDVGIGRAPGSDGLTAAALAYGNPLGPEYFPTKVVDLAAFLEGSEPATRALEGLTVTPRPDDAPELWLLGSSGESAGLAARLGLPFSFAHFINPFAGSEISRGYRRAFEPRVSGDRPRVSVGVFVICADTEEQARRLEKSRDLWRLRADRGRLEPFPSVNEALAWPYTPEELARIEANRPRQVVGTPEQVEARLLEIADEHQADELVVLTITHAFADRLRSYELLARAFALDAPRLDTPELDTTR
jgi:luciferase family oxidoreductase group 1